ncbi:hypothetical protein RJ639_005821, partial [Escallonia herrerae]
MGHATPSECWAPLMLARPYAVPMLSAPMTPRVLVIRATKETDIWRMDVMVKMANVFNFPWFCVPDIDECADPAQNRCEKMCINTPGSYRCSCPSGYISIGYLCSKDIGNRSARMAIIGTTASIGTRLLLVGIWWLYRIMKKRKKALLKEKFFKRNGGLVLQQQLSSGEEGNVEKTKLFTSKELDKATDHYNEDRSLGQGGQGTVYKGMLTDGRIVAIKKPKTENEGKLEQFINEV